MAIDRRSFLIGTAGATLALAGGRAIAASPQRFVSAWTDGEQTAGVSTFDTGTGILTTSALPGRGHAITLRPGSRDLIVFARRPGRFATVLDCDSGRVSQTFDAETARHFFGHGVFSADGKLLFSSENDIAGERGVLGIRDATDGYKPIGSLATAGIGPHDVALLSDRRTIVVANGGVDTDPNGRDVVNLAEMRASLAYVDLTTGDVIETMSLDESLRFLSIRHLALGSRDVVAFGCQWQGEVTEHPPLVGVHRRGTPSVLLSAPADVHRRLRGYIGSVAIDRSCEVLAASSPKGGLVVYWDIGTGRYLGMTEFEDVCGLTTVTAAGGFALSSGTGVVACTQTANTVAASRKAFDVHWDNHLLSLG